MTQEILSVCNGFKLFVALPLDKLDRMGLQRRVVDIGRSREAIAEAQRP